MKETISLKQILYANLIGFIVIITSTIFLNIAMAGSQNKIIEGHSFLSNIFWVNITFMGDAIFAFAIIFLLLFFFSNKDLSLKLLLNLLFILMIVQFIKNIFSAQPIQLYFEAGNYLYKNNAFINNNIISSHTAIAFMLSLFFANRVKNFFVKVFIFALAAAVVYSRIYVVGDSVLAITLGLMLGLCSIIILHNVGKIKSDSQFYKKIKHRHTSTHKLLKA